MSPEFIRSSPEIETFDPKLSTHWTMAVRHGDHVAKVRVAPVSESAKNATHQPLDLTRRIYAESAKIRRELNHQPQREPTRAGEVLPLPGGENDLFDCARVRFGV